LTVYKEGYICPVCGPVTAKLWWSNEEDDLVASCTKCGAKIQRVIQIPFSTRIPLEAHGEAEE